MFLDRHDLGRRTLLVHIDQQQSDLATSAELAELASSAGLETIGCLSSKRKIPHPKTFVGGGKVDEIASWIAERECDLIVFGDDLSPTQERNLEKALQRRVLGRTGLILEIFARRARTHEGKLQVELAQLDHAASTVRCLFLVEFCFTRV